MGPEQKGCLLRSYYDFGFVCRDGLIIVLLTQLQKFEIRQKMFTGRTDEPPDAFVI